MPSRRDVLKAGGLVGAGLIGGGTARYGAWTPAPLDVPRGTWLQPRYDRGNTGHNPHATPPTDDPDLVWTYDVPESVTALAAGVGHLYVGTEHAVYAFEGGARHSHWDVAARGHHLAVSDDVVVAVGSGMAAAFAASNGDLWWRHDTDSRVYNVLVDRQLAYVGSPDGLVAYALDSGERRWSITHNTETYPAFAGDRLLLGESNLAAYEPRTPLEGVLADSPTRVWESNQVYGPTRPVVGDDHVFAGETNCFQTDTCGVNVLSRSGEHEHHIELGNSAGSVATDGERAYVVSLMYGDSENGYNVPDSTTLHAIDPDSGDELWSFQRPGWFCPPVVANDTVYVGESGSQHGNGNLHALDAERGTQRWTYEYVDGVTELAAVGGSLFVGADAGGVRELR